MKVKKNFEPYIHLTLRWMLWEDTTQGGNSTAVLLHLFENCLNELQSKYSEHSTHYLGKIFINGEKIALLESNFHFQIEDWNLSTVTSFEVTNVEYIVTCLSQKVTREIWNGWRLLVSVGLKLQGIFLNIQEHFLCIYSTLVFSLFQAFR